jgi:hypothetical protein
LQAQKGFYGKNKSILKYSYKGFSILAQTVFFKDNAKLELQSVKIKLKTQNYEKSFKF